jgi:hypothetical protein
MLLGSYFRKWLQCTDMQSCPHVCFLFNSYFMQFDVHLVCVMSCVYLLRNSKQ